MHYMIHKAGIKQVRINNVYLNPLAHFRPILHMQKPVNWLPEDNEQMVSIYTRHWPEMASIWCLNHIEPSKLHECVKIYTTMQF